MQTFSKILFLAPLSKLAHNKEISHGDLKTSRYCSSINPTSSYYFGMHWDPNVMVPQFIGVFND